MKKIIKKKSRRAIQTEIYNKGIEREISKLTEPRRGFRSNAIFAFFKTRNDRQGFLGGLIELGYANLQESRFKGFDYEYVVCFCHEEPLYEKSPESLAKQVLYMLWAKHYKGDWLMYQKDAQD